MWVTRVISDGGLKISANGFTVDIRIPWYRSLPLSTVSIGELKVDGELISAERIRFELNGKTFAIDELRDHPEEWWFVLDSALLNVAGIELSNGSSHSVSVAVGVRPPYIPGFFRLTECTKQLTVN
jgi:hypothetical protein